MATTPVFLPGKSHGRRSLEGYSPSGRKRVRHNLMTKQQQFMCIFVLVSQYGLHRVILCQVYPGQSQFLIWF